MNTECDYWNFSGFSHAKASNCLHEKHICSVQWYILYTLLNEKTHVLLKK